MQQQAQPVVLEVAEAVTDSLDLLDQQVHRLGRAVGHPAGVEVGEQLIPPGVDGAGQAAQLGDLGIGATDEPVQQPLLGPVAAGLGEEQPQILGGDPGPADLFVVGVPGVQAGQQPFPGPVAEVVRAAAQQPANREQRVVASAAVPGGLLLHSAAYLVHRGEAEPGDVERVQHPVASGRLVRSAVA